MTDRPPSALMRIPTGTLAARLALARTTLMFGQSPRCRIRALAEIDRIRRELRRREAEAA